MSQRVIDEPVDPKQKAIVYDYDHGGRRLDSLAWIGLYTYISEGR